jgi:hypothetical protein
LHRARRPRARCGSAAAFLLLAPVFVTLLSTPPASMA